MDGWCWKRKLLVNRYRMIPMHILGRRELKAPSLGGRGGDANHLGTFSNTFKHRLRKFVQGLGSGDRMDSIKDMGGQDMAGQAMVGS